MRIAVVQTDPVFGSPAVNIQKAIGLMEGAAADLYVLPELCSSGYNFIDEAEARSLAEEVRGSSYQAFVAFAKKTSCYIAYGFAEQADTCYNSAALVGPAGLVGLYRKVHLFYRETLFFSPGNLSFPVFDLPFGRVGMMVCFDWLFPESTRTLMLNGAQLILHPSNLVMPHCPDAMVTRCLENRVFAATANRIGQEQRGGIDLRFIGKSEIVSPRGEILTRLGEEEEGVRVVEIDLALASDKKLNDYNNLLSDRRPDQYGPSGGG
jgi:predicted amidohydrolase